VVKKSGNGTKSAEKHNLNMSQIRLDRLPQARIMRLSRSRGIVTMSYASELQRQVQKVRPKLASVVFTHRNIRWLTAVMDLAVISVASVVGGLVYHRVFLQSAGPVLPLLGIAANTGLIFVLLTQLRGLYRTPALMASRKQIASAAVNWMLALLMVTAILFLLKIGEAHSRGAMVAFGLLGMVLLSGSSLIISGKLREATALGMLAGPKALVIGDLNSSVGCALNVLCDVSVSTK
jgi:hypothetical protein